MKNLSLRNICLFICTALLAVSCASVEVKTRPQAPTVDLEKDKFLIMPITLHGLPGDKLEQSAALFGGFLATFGDKAIPLQPLQPALEAAGLGGYSWKLAHGMYHMASVHGIFDPKKDSDQAEIPLIVEGVGKLATLAAEQLELDFKPKYVVSAHVDGLGSSVPGSLSYRVIAGIYNLEAGKIDKVVYYDQDSVDDDKVVLGEMGTLGSKLYGLLFSEEKAE